MSEHDNDPAFRRAEDWERLAVLEVRVNGHEEDLQTVFKNQEILNEGVAGINNKLNKIFYVVAGALGTFIIQEYGVLEILSKLL